MMEEKIHTDEYGEKSIIVYDDTGKELYQKYPSGGDEDIISEWIYNEKNQLVSKVDYLAYGVSEFGTETLEGCSLLGKGNGNPLQDSCLETPMDREAWRTQLND